MTKTLNTKKLQPYRRSLRKKMTFAEVALWLMIKNKQLDGVRFLRQYSVGNFILDFYTPQFKLAIELDGDGHFTEQQMEYDKKRDEYLNSQGIKVLRFENFEVIEYPDRTLEEIRKYIV